MSTCQSWCTAVLARARLIPCTTFTLPSLRYGDSVAETAQYFQDVQSISSAAARTGPRETHYVQLSTGPLLHAHCVQVRPAEHGCDSMSACQLCQLTVLHVPCRLLRRLELSLESWQPSRLGISAFLV